MAQPLRKVRLKNTSASDTPRRFTVSLSGAALAALCLVLVAAVGWSFFMGFMVGRGQNPEKRVGQMTGMIQEEQTAGDVAVRDGSLAAQSATLSQDPSPVQPAAPQDPDALSGGDGTRQAEPGAVAPSGPANSLPGNGATRTGDTRNAPAVPAANAQAASPAYPFSRPQGEGLAAWGISRNPAPASSTPAADAQGGRLAAQRQPATQAVQAPQGVQQKTPLFDWLFQAAAFKDKMDADKLRARLEGRGLRTRQQKSGKVLLVMVSLRGTELDAANLREELQRMKLGAPVLAAKKPVSGTSRKGR